MASDQIFTEFSLLLKQWWIQKGLIGLERTPLFRANLKAVFQKMGNWAKKNPLDQVLDLPLELNICS